MSFRFDINQRLYKQVAANSSDSLDYVPASGEKIFIVNLGVSSSTAPQTVACIAWGPDGNTDILLSSYSEVTHRDVNIERTGDGIKKLRIYLANDLSEPAYMGGFIQGVQL